MLEKEKAPEMTNILLNGTGILVFLSSTPLSWIDVDKSKKRAIWTFRATQT